MSRRFSQAGSPCSSPSAPDEQGCRILPGRDLYHALEAGMQVVTATGIRPIEDIRPGDRLITRDRGITPALDVVPCPLPVGAKMVHIPAGSLGQGRPTRDIRLLPGQPIALRGWRSRTLFGAYEARIAAGRLVDGRIITRIPVVGAPAWALIMDGPFAVQADGLDIVTASVDAQVDG